MSKLDVAILSSILGAFALFSLTLLWAICHTRVQSLDGKRFVVARLVSLCTQTLSPLSNGLNRLLFHASDGMVVLRGSWALVFLLVLLAYASIAALATGQFRGDFLVKAPELWAAVCVITFVSALFRTGDTISNLLLALCCILILTIMWFSDTTRLTGDARLEWIFLLAVLMGATSLGLILGFLKPWFVSPSGVRHRALVYSALIAILTGYLWFRYVGAYNIALDVVVIILSFAAAALYMSCHLNRFR